MENIRNRVNVELVTTMERHDKLVRKPEFKSSLKITDGFKIVRKRVTRVTMNKPIYVGFSNIQKPT